MIGSILVGNIKLIDIKVTSLALSDDNVAEIAPMSKLDLQRRLTN